MPPDQLALLMTCVCHSAKCSLNGTNMNKCAQPAGVLLLSQHSNSGGLDGLAVIGPCSSVWWIISAERPANLPWGFGQAGNPGCQNHPLQQPQMWVYHPHRTSDVYHPHRTSDVGVPPSSNLRSGHESCSITHHFE